MRPIWSGSVSFGLVNIPVKLYLAAQSERFSFRMLHKKDEGPIQFRRFCSLEDKEVPYEEIARGFEYEKGQFVLIEDQDFERIERAASHTVEVQQFVGREEIDPAYFETPYYLEPARGAEKAYALLREALRRSNKIGVGRVALREREYVAAVHVMGEAVCLSTMRWPTELRSPSGLAIPAEGELPERQLELAHALIEQLSAPFEPAAFKDDHRERMEKMIQEKLAGLPAPKKAAPRPVGQVVDLADALERSIAGAKSSKRAGEDKGERRVPRQLAAREVRTKRTRKQ